MITNDILEAAYDQLSDEDKANIDHQIACIRRKMNLIRDENGLRKQYGGMGRGSCLELLVKLVEKGYL